MNGSLLQNTLWVGLGSTGGAMAIGLMVAVVLSSAGRTGRGVLLGLSLVVLALPPFLLANTWMHYLGETGVWRTWLPLDLFSPAGAILVLAFWLWPVTALTVWGCWQRLEPAHLEAEPDLRGVLLFRFLLLPMARGALLVAGLVTLVLAANNLTVPALLQVNVYPAEVWLSFSSSFWVNADGAFDWVKAASLSWPLIALPLILMMGLRRRVFPWPVFRGGTPPGLFRRVLGTRALMTAVAGTLLALLVSAGLPLWQIGGNAQTWRQLPDAVAAGRSAMLNSLGVASMAATACVALALVGLRVPLPGRPQPPAGPRIRRQAGSTLLWLPFLVPGVLIGIALILTLNRPLTTWFYQSLGVVILALVIRYLALGWSLARHALRSTDPELMDAARLAGASRWQQFRHVLWPQLLPQLAAAWAIVFLLSLWDVETLVLIVPPGGETLALRIFNLLHYGHAAHVNALCLILLGLALLPLLIGIALLKLRTRVAGRSLARALTAAVGIGVVFSLMSGCAPGLASNEAPVNSGIFDRVQIIATRGVAPGQVNKPRSVAVDHEDNLFVLDFTGRVQKFSPAGEFLLFWQMPETRQGNPKGLSVDPDGNLIVVEPHYSRANLFTPEGHLLMQWGEKGTNAGQFSFPRAAVVNSRREWFVSEFGVVDRVQKFAFEPGEPPALRFLAAYGRAGAGPGEFNRAEGLCVDARDRILVADAVNHRVQLLDRAGGVLRQFGKAGRGPGELGYPYDVCVDRAGRCYVCEFGNSRIQVFDGDGHPVEILGGPGAAPGFFNNPWGVALDSRGNLYVADSQNHRVQKFLRRPEVSLNNGAAAPPRGTTGPPCAAPRTAAGGPVAVGRSAPACWFTAVDYWLS